MITGSPLMISSDGMEPTRFDSMSKIEFGKRIYNNLSLVKMPLSNCKDRAYEFNSGIGKCPCGQTFEYTSKRDMKMKLRMHLRFCSNPPKGFDKIGIPKKAMTLREQQLPEAERMKNFTINIYPSR